MSVDLRTKYLGFSLKNPLVVSASPLTDQLDNAKKLEAAGAAAVVLHSLFEEQIAHEEQEMHKVYEYTAESFAEALSYFPDVDDYRRAPENYLDHITHVKKAVSIPVIGSLNGISRGGWIRYAKRIQEAGADALELNTYFVAADIEMSSEDVEKQLVDLVAEVKQSISIPLAVKIGPHFSSVGHVAKKLVAAGADGLVLFNRFLQPDIDLETLEVAPRLELSTDFEQLLPLRWVAILRGRIDASLALTTGIHTPEAMVKAILAGADVGMVVSTLYKNGFDQVGAILKGLCDWMEEKEYESVEQMKGSMSQVNCPNPSAFERGNYMKALTSFVGPA